MLMYLYNACMNSAFNALKYTLLLWYSHVYLPDHVRYTYGEDTEVEIIYEDLPCNDFNSLFLLSQG